MIQIFRMTLGKLFNVSSSDEDSHLFPPTLSDGMVWSLPICYNAKKLNLGLLRYSI